MKIHKVTGGGGTQLHVVETGNPKGRPILFIHGMSQSWGSWTRQLDSDLASDYRLVAMDMRGHGQSDKPRDAYADSKLWADDVNAVIKTLSLDHPILSGWSYGPLVILDYIRHYGENDIGGIHFVSGLNQLGTEATMSVLTPEFLALVPGFFSADVEEAARSLESLLRMCMVEEPSAEDIYPMLGASMMVPPWVRQALLSRAFDNNDVMPNIRKPVMITHGAKDVIVRPAVVDQHKAGMPHARVDIIENAGHAPFWENPKAFNRSLREFAESI